MKTALLLVFWFQSLMGLESGLYFSSQEDIGLRFLEKIEEEKISVRIASERISQKEIVEALVAAHKRKVVVEVIVDSISVTKNTPLHFLVKEGVNVFVWQEKKAFRNKGGTKRMKHAFCVFGTDLSWIGSYKFSSTLQAGHAEEALCLKDEKIAKGFLEEFDLMKTRFCQPFSSYVNQKSKN